MARNPAPRYPERSAVIVRLDPRLAVAEEREQELGELRARLHRREQELAKARYVLILVLRSRVYRLMRALGRWGWLEHRIRCALR